MTASPTLPTSSVPSSPSSPLSSSPLPPSSAPPPLPLPSPLPGNAAVAVLDTNVWLDWLVFDDAALTRLRSVHGAGALTLVAASDTRAELAQVLTRAAFGLDDRAVAARLAEHDRLVQPHEAPRAPCALRCADPDDQMFLDLAVAVRATWLVTKDRALLRLAPRARRDAGLRIVRPPDL